MITFKTLRLLESERIKKLDELTINTAAGTQKVIRKIPTKTITGKTIMAYPGKSSSSKGGGSGDGGDGE
ncbi:MAG: hypothetical protein ACO294_07590 [Methylococcales bacterium]|jgi:hypothetical protein